MGNGLAVLSLLGARFALGAVNPIVIKGNLLYDSVKQERFFVKVSSSHEKTRHNESGFSPRQARRQWPSPRPSATAFLLRCLALMVEGH